MNKTKIKLEHIFDEILLNSYVDYMLIYDALFLIYTGFFIYIIVFEKHSFPEKQSVKEP